MSKSTERLRNHVASHKSLSRHRQNCLDVCGEVERLTAEVNELTKKITEIHWCCGREDLPPNKILPEIIEICDRD